MADFRFFKMAAAAILDFGKFKFLQFGRSTGSNCVHVPNFVEIAQTAAEIWRLFNFLRWPPSAILDFQKLEILTSGPLRRLNMRQHAKFREDRSNHSRDMANFQFFKMPAVRHVGLVLRVLGPPTLSQRHMDLHVWSYPRPDYIFQVSSKSVQGSRSPGGSKFGLSHYFG